MKNITDAELEIASTAENDDKIFFFIGVNEIIDYSLCLIIRKILIISSHCIVSTYPT